MMRLKSIKKERLMKLTEKQWTLINEIALMIHLTDDVTEMRKHFLSVLSVLLEFDHASFYIQENENPYGSPLGINLSQKDLTDYIDKYSGTDPYTPFLGVFLDANTTFRSSDCTFTANIENTKYYRLVWKPKNIKYSLLMPLSVNKSWLGSVNLFRSSDKNDFTEIEMEITNILRQHLQTRLWREKCFQEKQNAERENAGKPHTPPIQKISDQYALTNRECDVISLWIKGFTDCEICDHLFISNNTLKKHISNIFRKLEINSRVELLKIINAE